MHDWRLGYTSDPSGICLGIMVIIVSICLSINAKTTIMESNLIEYQLKDPLSINAHFAKRTDMDTRIDSNGRIIFNNEDNKEKIDTFNFKKGDTIQIKIIDESNALNGTNKKDWRNARVYIILEDRLEELNYNDIKKQEIDKLIKELYEQ